MPRLVIVAAADGGEAAAEALALEDGTDQTGGRMQSAVWVGEEGSPAYEEFAAELARRHQP